MKEERVRLSFHGGKFIAIYAGRKEVLPDNWKPESDVLGFYNLVFLGPQTSIVDVVAIWAAQIEGAENRLRTDANITKAQDGDFSPWSILDYAVKMHTYRMRAKFLLEQAGVGV